MKKETLSTTAAAELQRRQAAAAAVERTMRKQRRQEESRQRFTELNARNQAVVSKVGALVAEAPRIELQSGRSHLPFSDEFRKKIIVVTDTPAGEDHAVLCGVTLVERILYRRRQNGLRELVEVGNEKSAEFAFALVPNSLVDYFLSDPHDLHNPTRTDVYRYDPEESLPVAATHEGKLVATEGTRFADLAMLSWRQRRHAMLEVEGRVNQSEASLSIVADALLDTRRNPHIQLSASALAEGPMS